MKEIGHMVDVPVVLTIAIRGSQTQEQAIAAAEAFFAQKLEWIANDNKVQGWQQEVELEGQPNFSVEISEVSLEFADAADTKVIDTLLETDNGEVWSEDLLP